MHRPRAAARMRRGAGAGLAGAAAAAALFLLAGGAGAKTYDCTMKAHSPFGWIAPRLMIIVAEDRSKALVYDAIIGNSFGEPIPVALKQRNSSALELSWTVPDIPVDNLKSTIGADFIAVLREAQMKITLRVFLQGGDIEPSGSGTCKLVK